MSTRKLLVLETLRVLKKMEKRFSVVVFPLYYGKIEKSKLEAPSSHVYFCFTVQEGKNQCSVAISTPLFAFDTSSGCNNSLFNIADTIYGKRSYVAFGDEFLHEAM